MAYPRIDTSPLFMPPRPSALSQGMGQVGDIMTALMQRRREQERQAILDQQKAEELQFRKDQEERLTKRQTSLDEREENRLNRQDQHQQRSAIAEAYTKNPAAIPAIAQLYGGSVAPKKPNYTNENDPLGPEIPMLSDVQEDDSYLGFNYGMNPEHERRTQEAAGKQVVSMPGMEPIELPTQPQSPQHFAKLRAVLQGMGPGPEQALALRSLEQSEALGLDPHKTNEALEAVRADQRMRDLAAQRRKGGGRGGAGKPSDVRGDFTAFRGAATQWETVANVDKLTDAWDKFRELSSNVEDANRSGDTISRKSALYQAARYITGPGVLTPAEFENTVQRTGGSIGSLLTELEKRKSGDISDIEAAALEKFVTNAKNAVQRRAANAIKDYDRRFGSGLVSTNPTMKAERDAYRNSLLQRFEIQDPSASQGNAVGVPKALMKPADMERLNRIKVR